MNIFTKILKKFSFEKLISDGSFENDTADSKPGVSIFESSTSSMNKEPPVKKASEYLKEMKGWVYTCVNAISEKVADTQWKLYKYNTKGEVEEVFNHPVLDSLYKINEFSTKFDHFWLTTATLELTGEAPWYLERDEKGTILGIYILRPDRINILFDADKLISGYEYKIKKGGKSETILLAPDEVIFLKYSNPDNPFRGLGTLQAVARTVDIENYSEIWNEKFFYNSARPDGLLTVKVKRLSEEQRKRLKANIREYYQNVDNAHKLMVLSGDMDYKQFSLTQKDMDFMEQQNFSRNKILGIFRVPKVIVSQTDSVNYANAKTAERIFTLYTIKPKLQRITEQLNEFLLPLFPDGDSLFLDYVNPVPEELDDKIKKYKAGLGDNIPYLTINEVREKEHLAPLEGDAGNQIYIPAGLVAIGKTAKIKKALYSEDSNSLKSFKARTKDTRDLDGLRVNIRKIVKEKLKEAKKSKAIEKPKKKIKADFNKELFWNKQINISDKFEKKFISAMDSIFERQKKQVIASVKLSDGKKGLIKQKSLLNIVKERTIGVLIFNPLMKDVVKQEGQVASNLIDKELFFDVDSPPVREFIKKRPKDFLGDITETTNERIKKEIQEGVEKGEGIDKIRDRIGLLFDSFKAYRSERIARSEVIRASNFATEQSYIQSGVVEGKEWLTAFDERTCAACAEMNGKVEVLGHNFFDKGDSFSEIKFNYEAIEHPPLHVNCRCTMIPVITKKATPFVSLSGKSKEQDKYINENKKRMKKTLSKSEIESLQEYKNKEFMYINEQLRKETLSSDNRKKVSDIQKAISKNVIKDNLKVYRGSTMSVSSLSKLEKGAIFKDKAFISTSLEEEIAQRFSTAYAREEEMQKILFEIKLPKKSNGIFMEAVDSNLKHEKELLLQKGSKFKITEIYEEDAEGVIKIVLDYI